MDGPGEPMTFWRSLGAAHAGSLAFLAACPLLALVPTGFELAQHLVEARSGMYDSVAAFRAAADDPVRMAFGLLKIAALTVPTFWINRFLAHRDPAFARRLDSPAVRLFPGYFCFQMALAAILVLVFPARGWTGAASFVVGYLVNCLVIAWGVAAPLGNARVGLRASAALMVRRLPWTAAFTAIAMLPLMVPHYALAYLSIGTGPGLWPLLVTDSLLVGWLTAVITASGYVAATRAASGAGVRLVPSERGGSVRDPARDAVAGAATAGELPGRVRHGEH